ncbi:MAG TPA: hypothetical protein VN081_00345 [Dongiaceae bacterium]|nr:hypothetical protein [Dongiaceae bacterium]
MRLTCRQISQAEIQRLQWRLDAGDWPNEAAAWVKGFFDMHNQAMQYSCQFDNGLPSQQAYEWFCSQDQFNQFATS